MAFLLQYRRFKQRIQQQLAELDDHEKTAHPPHRQSRQSSDQTLRGTERAKAEDFRYAKLDGISVEEKENGEKYYLVDFEEDDPYNPRSWSTAHRLGNTFLLDAIAFVVTAASSIDSATAPQAAEALGVSEVVEALGGTGVFLATFGIGALFTAPASEMLGRWPVYVVSLTVFACWLVGAALSPNIAAQIVFRGLAGFFASAPLTVAGGSMSDLWSIKERTWAFPLFAVVGFGGPVLGPVIASYIGTSPHLSWRWSDWIMLIATGLVIFLVLAFKRETMAPRLLQYKARMFRQLTGDDRFLSQSEVAGHSLVGVLKKNFTRPFILALEPIVLAYTLYLTIVYIILFTFLDGYPYIFERTYGISQGLSNICFIGLLIGIISGFALVPLVVHITNKQLQRDDDDGSGSAINQETRTIFSMIGAPLIPIGLFWMGWTDYVRHRSRTLTAY
jgi:MFS family permease